MWVIAVKVMVAEAEAASCKANATPGSNEVFSLHSYDARDGEFTSGVGWADEGELGERAHFIPSSEPPTLVLEPVHAQDQGVYTCRVDYLLSPSTTAVVNLTVVRKYWNCVCVSVGVCVCVKVVPFLPVF